VQRPFARALDYAVDEAIAARHLVAAPEPEPVLDAANALATAVRAGGHLFVAGPTTMHSDVAHMTVEFVHPVVAGARDVASTPLVSSADQLRCAQLDRLARPGDVCAVFARSCADPGLQVLLDRARRHGVTTVALVSGPFDGLVGADHVIDVGGTDKEWFVTAYHVLWEVVQVILAREPVPA
jgi:D-sedoheptulose 7-phosphate isomerase